MTHTRSWAKWCQGHCLKRRILRDSVGWVKETDKRFQGKGEDRKPQPSEALRSGSSDPRLVNDGSSRKEWGSSHKLALAHLSLFTSYSLPFTHLPRAADHNMPSLSSLLYISTLACDVACVPFSFSIKKKN